ncbi:MAG: MFS transporter [Anaerolineae bacterium]|nr:MFS transporter [Anaerolineae bacterium]
MAQDAIHLPAKSDPGGEVRSTPISFWVKLVYGAGDVGMASFNTLRQFFYAIFLTDTVGLDPRIASITAFLGVIWDAVNDPLVGAISDNVKTRWGRRRPFLLFFTVPFALGFVFLWWVPPIESQVLLALYVMMTYMLSDTLQTLVMVPFLSLTPEITSDYDQRTALTSYRMFFNLIASLGTAVVAPMIMDAMIKSGYSPQQGYMIVAALFGAIAIVPYLGTFFVVREQSDHLLVREERISLKTTLRLAWENVPFRFAASLYMLNWVTFDLVAMMLPFFLTYWIGSGDLLYKATLFGEQVALESVVLGAMFLVAIAALPLWTWLSAKLGKRWAYIAGMGFWAVVLCSAIFIQPAQVGLIIILAVLSGLGASTAHVLPDAIFPDVIEWDELRTRKRHEGVYYGIKNFARKLAGAVSIFVVLQALGWFGYRAPPEGATQFAQSTSTLWAIRILTGPVGVLMLIGSILVAWFYPLNKEKHTRMRRLLAKRRRQEERRQRRLQRKKGLSSEEDAQPV